MSEYSTFVEQGERLKKIMKHLKVNGLQLSELIGLSPQYISMMITGKKQLSSSILHLIAERFPNVSIDYLLKEQGSMMVQVNEPKQPYITEAPMDIYNIGETYDPKKMKVLVMHLQNENQVMANQIKLLAARVENLESALPKIATNTDKNKSLNG
jgi:transcriptional regulator with XRE-family HTH domain